uniref:Secreted protein n=1 Tax=Knipowitschia caucasica TaxID=637954 RepID=A0AAV2JPM9_KNICA
MKPVLCWVLVRGSNKWSRLSVVLAVDVSCLHLRAAGVEFPSVEMCFPFLQPVMTTSCVVNLRLCDTRQIPSCPRGGR